MHRIDVSKLFDLRDELDTVVEDASRWTSLMDRIAAASGGCGATLMNDQGDALPGSESIKEAMEVYHRDNWFDQDLRRRAITRKSIVVRDQDIVSEEEMRRSPIYADLLTRFNVPWWASINFKTDRGAYALSLFRTRQQGFFQDEETGALQALSSKLREVVSLSELISKQATAGLVASLDQLGVAAFAIDARGIVVDHNEAAERLLGDQLLLRDRRLMARDPAAIQAVNGMTAPVAARPSPATAEFAIIARPIRGPLILQRVPLPPSLAGPFKGAAFLITARELDPQRSPNEAVLIKAFGLTKTEARVAAMLASGHSIDTLAKALLISKETARSHLRAIFSKTSYRRQSELTAAVARLNI